MKKSILFLIVISLLIVSGCTDNSKGPEANNDINNSNKIDNNNQTTNVNLDYNDPSLYVSAINEIEDGMLWRSRDINYPQEEVSTINKEILCSTIWDFNPLENTLLLVFYLDDEFRMGSYQAGIETGGKYEILSDNTIRLYDFKYSIDRVDEMINLENGEVNLTFKNNFDNIFYSNALVGSDPTIFFGAFGEIEKEGNIYLVDGYKTVKESWQGITIDRVKFRTEPSVNSDTKEVYYEDYRIDELDYFLKGTDIYVIGRTNEKYKVGDIENYWYYIGYNPFEGLIYGWVFGEYIEKYDESKDEEYSEMYNKDLEAFVNKNK